MYTLVYDGTFEGLLTAVFEIYERKLFHVKLIKGEWRASALFEEVLEIITDENRANRVLRGLRKRLSVACVQRLYIAHMAEMENEENAIVGFIRYAFDADRNIEEDYGNKYVMRISEIIKMVRREKHRMEAFVRFQKLKDETFYSAVEPDFNVLPLLIRHFKDRYADQKWMIYDIKRRYGIYYDLHDTQYISLDFSETSKPTDTITIVSHDELMYQSLWKNYFSSTNIVSRKNTKLHLRHIPKRYWRHLTEKF
ncbi:TIGR03915 family putative DNA repair protein [Mucilaginibacter sp. SG564]|uniref:TIGR03915 family putative DNA repair protein n=1 Tax=Mucilaginibacter sp. SG564 TaxID=2587022 RepID=UPI0015569951|nr:TIGR03915 family putative DNA repair protein [Mucilaginibacter sp. SG564]NOW93955.1 putative DNA metabolism protein [Mucilaginibacter sp. SG564]